MTPVGFLQCRSVGDIPVDGSMRASEILRCCAALEAFFDERLRLRCHEEVSE